jgi:hypothetical protein
MVLRHCAIRCGTLTRRNKSSLEEQLTKPLVSLIDCSKIRCSVQAKITVVIFLGVWFDHVASTLPARAVDVLKRCVAVAVAVVVEVDDLTDEGIHLIKGKQVNQARINECSQTPR